MSRVHLYLSMIHNVMYVLFLHTLIFTTELRRRFDTAALRDLPISELIDIPAKQTLNQPTYRLAELRSSRPARRDQPSQA